jgi:GNAT superfamily N-acetyltransferase
MKEPQTRAKVTAPAIGYARIEWLWVRDDHRRQGLGKQLVRAAGAEAARRRYGLLRVDSHTFQAPASTRSSASSGSGSPQTHRWATARCSS